MDWSNSFSEFLNQISEVQRQFFTNATSVIPGMQDSSQQRMRENFDNALNFQEQAVTTSLELQSLLARLTIESQKQLWNSYFNMLRSK
jgi:hypothetical protein